MPLPLLPDSEALLVAALAAQPSITAITGTRIGTRIPDAPIYPLIRVVRIGGGPDSGSAELAIMQVECWADTDAAASTLARTVAAAVLDLRNVTGSTWLGRTDFTLGPLPLPDPDSQRVRYLLELELFVGWV